MKKIKFFTILISVCLLSLCTSCKKNQKQVQFDDSIQLTVQTSTNTDALNSENQKWHITNKKVCVIFGFDFNSPEIVEEYTALLQNRYGLESDGGLIYTMIYPDSFKHGGKSYVSELTAELTNTDRDLAGIIILGAPENTHTAFGRLQDYWERSVPFPIYALFPQDDVLGLESTCDFVLDKEQTTDITGNVAPEETTFIKIPDAPEILTQCIDYMLEIEGPFIKNNTLPKHIQQMLKNKKIHNYVDPETGIQSINHFILD